MNLRLLIALCFLVVTTAFSPLSEAIDDEKISPVDSITLAELRDHMFYLASDELEGRDTGSRGYDLAAQYAAIQLRASGLEPGYTDSDGNRSFFQPVPMESTSIGENNSFVISMDGKSNELAFGEGYLLFSAGSGESLPALEAVFLGYGVSEPDHGWDDYSGIDVSGKLVICTMKAPKKDGKNLLPDEVNSRYVNWFRAMGIKMTAAREHGAAAVAFVPNDQISKDWDQIRAFMTRARMSYKDEAAASSNETVPITILSNEAIKTIFEKTGYDQNSLKGDDNGDYRTFPLEDITFKLNIEQTKSDVSTRNVVALIPGTDPDVADQVITIGAHLDHVGVRDGNVYNGADDNASGSVAALEVAEALAMSPGRRPVLVILYTAEEKGLIGSRHFVASPTVPLENIMVNLNMDMVGRYDVDSTDANILFAVGGEEICKQLQTILGEVNARTLNLPLEYEDTHDYFPRSDQVSFHRAGIPSVFLTIDDHVDYHKPTDTPEKIHYGNLRKITQLVYEVTMELANMEEKLCSEN